MEHYYIHKGYNVEMLISFPKEKLFTDFNIQSSYKIFDYIYDFVNYKESNHNFEESRDISSLLLFPISPYFLMSDF